MFNDGCGVRHVFFVAETKGSLDKMELRGVEKAKTECAQAAVQLNLHKYHALWCSRQLRPSLRHYRRNRVIVLGRNAGGQKDTRIAAVKLRPGALMPDAKVRYSVSRMLSIPPWERHAGMRSVGCAEVEGETKPAALLPSVPSSVA